MNAIKSKVYSLALIAALMSPSLSLAQGVSSEELNQEVDAELSKISSAAKPVQSSGAVVTQTIVVPQQSTEVVKQPVTVVEASPLSASKAESIRKNRQDEEMRTETRIVEKLEQSRLEDEKRRAGILFGDKFENMNTAESANAQSTAVQMAPSSQVAPQPIVIQQQAPAETLSRDVVREEIRTALNEKEVNDLADKATFEKKYVAGLAGMMVYPDFSTYKSDYSLGLAFGVERGSLALEGGMNFSRASVLGSYLMNNGYFFPQAVSGYMNVENYQGFGAARFILIDSFIKPSLGGVAAYTYRNYRTGDNFYGYSADLGNSHSFDLGVNAALDVALAQNMSLGLDLKYMFNISHSASNNGTSVPGMATLEKSNYFLTGVSVRFLF